MRWRLSGILIGLWAANCAAQTPPPGEDSPPIVICYWTRAVVAGMSKCDPPSDLVGAVFGACKDPEEKVRRQVLSERNGADADWQRDRIADIAIRHIRERMSPQIQGWILDAQRSALSICKSQKQ